jgi:hypothetical protein
VTTEEKKDLNASDLEIFVRDFAEHEWNLDPKAFVLLNWAAKGLGFSFRNGHRDCICVGKIYKETEDCVLTSVLKVHKKKGVAPGHIFSLTMRESNQEKERKRDRSGQGRAAWRGSPDFEYLMVFCRE